MEKVITTQPKVENEAELETIRKKFSIDEKRFKLGVAFVTSYLDHGNKTKAYEEASGCSKEVARKNAGSLHRGKWIQELIRYMTPEDSTLYVGEIKDIIFANMEIIRDRGSSPREIAECTKALQPYIKAAKLELEMELEIKASIGESNVVKLNESLKQLAGAGKMINEHGDIIDVTIIE